jgi:hypothetical protein
MPRVKMMTHPGVQHAKATQSHFLFYFEFNGKGFFGLKLCAVRK